MNNVSSPRNDDESIEHEIQRKGLTAARITPGAIEANIRAEHYFTAADGYVGNSMHTPEVARENTRGTPLELLTFCVLVLNNGFTVTGESAVASPENFDPDVGRRVARQNAVQKVWPLMGYALRLELARQAHEEPSADPAAGSGPAL